MKLYKPFRYVARVIPYTQLTNVQPFVQWKSRLLFILLAGMLFLGLLAYIPSVTLAIIQDLWSVVIIDTVVYAAVLFVALSKKMPAKWKLNSILITFYLLGIGLLLLLGKEGAGFNWLFLFPLLSSFFYEFRGIVISTIINIVSLALLFIPVYYQLEAFGLIAQYNPGGWIVNSINFITISVFASLGLTIVIWNIDKALKKEKRTRKLLQKNSEQLEIEKEKAQESDRLKSAFLANMSHEIRTPLNAIIGFSDLISNTELPKEKLKKFGSLIDMAGNQLATIIDDIIDISKIERGQMDLHIKEMEVYPCLKNVVDIHTSRIETLQKNIEIHLETDKSLKDLVLETDEARFKQIASNLVGNAVKYTEEGFISVGYSIKNKSGKKVVEFFVKDTGRGIPEAFHKKIFERFAQADNVDFNEGTGLGLSITKGLLEMLGGEIWLQSELDKGSIFYFTLPVTSNNSKQKPDADQEVDSVESPDLAGKLIYIAEDDNFSYSLIHEALEPHNAKLKKAENGEELLLLIKQQVPDLVLLDIKMPVMDGITAINKIRAQYPHLPVIAQTAFAMPEDREKYEQHGFDACITKPFLPNDLIHIVNTWIHKKDKK